MGFEYTGDPPQFHNLHITTHIPRIISAAMSDIAKSIMSIFSRGGPVMWPLLVLSVLSLTLIVERALFWRSAHRRGRARWLASLAERLRAGDHPGARAIIASDRTLYAAIGESLLNTKAHDSLAVELVEQFRHSFERFGATLSTIITAAPLLGILGTVIGIIQSFDLLSQTRDIADIEAVASGIAQALITTAFGLIVALVTLFPYMIFRAHADRAQGAIEYLTSALLGAQSD